MKASDFLSNNRVINLIKSTTRPMYIFKDGNAYEVELVRAVLPISDTADISEVQYDIRYKGKKKLFPVSYGELSSSNNGMGRPDISCFNTSGMSVQLTNRDILSESDQPYTYVFAPDRGLCRIDVRIDKVEYDYAECKWNIETSDEFGGKLKYYDSEGKCLADAEYDVFDKDGNLVEHYVGINKRMRLSDKQQEIVDRLNAVLDECRDNDLEIIMNLERYQVEVLNIAPLMRVDGSIHHAYIMDNEGHYRNGDVINVHEHTVPLDCYSTDINEEYKWCPLADAQIETEY